MPEVLSPIARRFPEAVRQQDLASMLTVLHEVRQAMLQLIADTASRVFAGQTRGLIDDLLRYRDDALKATVALGEVLPPPFCNDANLSIAWGVVRSLSLQICTVAREVQSQLQEYEEEEGN